MSVRGGRKSLLFLESNTSGTGYLFALAARDLGFRPVLVTSRPEKYGYLSRHGCPDVMVVPTADEDEIERMIRRRFAGGRDVAGITSSSESFVAAAASLARRFGLPGPDAACVRAARDKSRQRRVLADGGLPTPRFAAPASVAEALAAARSIGFPVVVKPVDGTGSAGVRACASSAEVAQHASALFADCGARRILVESLVGGPEFSVEVFSGRIVGITRKHLGAPPHFVETGHDYPAKVSPDVVRALGEAVTRGTALLGLGWGPLHWELRMHAGRGYVMEVNPRLAGGFIPELVRYAEGIDLIRETLQVVSGGHARLEPRHRRHASIRFLLPPGSGRLRRARGIEDARAMEGIMDVALYRSPGEHVAVHNDFRDRIGHVIACADGFDACCAAADRARAAIHVGVEPSRTVDAASEAVERERECGVA
jgi:S-sulfo-L-cysteine synthase (3-phospho-L-serine-dependent)